MQNPTTRLAKSKFLYICSFNVNRLRNKAWSDEERRQRTVLQDRLKQNEGGRSMRMETFSKRVVGARYRRFQRDRPNANVCFGLTIKERKIELRKHLGHFIFGPGNDAIDTSCPFAALRLRKLQGLTFTM